MELEAILVLGQADLAVQEVLEVHKVQKEHQDHQKILAETHIGLTSSFVFGCNQLGLRSGIFLPEHNHIVYSRGSNAVLEKLKWATGQTVTPIGLERVFQRSTQAVDSPLAAKMSKSPPCALRQYTASEVHMRQKK